MVLERIKPALLLVKNKIAQVPRKLVGIALVGVALLLSIILSIVSIHQVHLLNKKLEQVTLKSGDTVQPHRDVEAMANEIDQLKILSPPANAMIVRNRFDIEGLAEENRVITLSVNGQLIQTTLVERGRFAFRNVEAKAGANHFVVRSISEDGSASVIEEITFQFGALLPAVLARDFSRGSLTEKKIALTFDGDYLDNITDEILDILKQEQVRCTMFLTGRFIRRYSETVKRMVAEHHEIGNHSWTHPHLTSYEQNQLHHTLPNVTAETVQQELLKTAELFRQITGIPMAPYWRAPYGEHNAEIRAWAAAAGFRHIGWTIGKNWDDGMDTLDWVADKNAPNYHSADEIATKIVSFAKNSSTGANGAIILMHLGSQRTGDYPHTKLPDIIRQLRELGYQFVTISELVQ